MPTFSHAIERLAASQRGLAERLPPSRVPHLVMLSSGDPSFATPDYVIRAAERAMRDGFTHYPPPQGDPQLREAIAAYHSRLSGMPISPAQVLVTAGGTGAISAAMLAFLNPGDEVLIMDPCYSLYADVARVVGTTVVHVPLTARFRVDLDGVRSALSGRTRMLVLNYPSNPTGQLLQPAELDGLAAIAAERDLAVVSDEVYDQLVFEGEHRSALAHPALAGRVVLVNSCSKTYAMTGWRIGWAVAPQEVIRAVLTMNRSVLGWPNAIAQRAALEALTNAAEDRKWRDWMLAQYRTQRKVMLEGLAAIPGVHVYELQAAFYAWVRYNAPLPSVDLMKYLYERGLAVRPGTEFGRCGEQHLRLSFSPAPEIIAAGVQILRSALEELAAEA